MVVVDEKLKIPPDRIVPALIPEAVYLFGSRATRVPADIVLVYGH